MAQVEITQQSLPAESAPIRELRPTLALMPPTTKIATAMMGAGTYHAGKSCASSSSRRARTLAGTSVSSASHSALFTA